MDRPTLRRAAAARLTARPLLALAAALMLSLAALACPARAAEPPAVVVSIKPIHALVAAIMQDVAVPALIVTGAASPHDYALKPSDATALEGARLVFWMGPSLEGFLVKPVRTLGPAASVPLGERLGDRIRPMRLEPLHDEAEAHGHDEDEDHHDHDHEHADEHGDGDHHDEAEGHEHGHGHSHVDAEGRPLPDLHAWLDPTIAAAMVDIIASALKDADPERAALYDRNAGTLKDRLAALDAELAETLAPVKGRPFIVFHDAYQYFEARYGLSGIGSLTISPDASPGARRLAALRAEIEAGGAVCVFAEPQFEPKLVRALIEGTAVKSASLDPEGANYEPGPETYFALLRDMARTLRDCLSG
ncbi:MAG: zinc ABC transporter substrate-binding protein [Alphaproteobacteria bacterium]